MKKHLFCGCCTAIVTPYRDGDIDLETLGKLIRRQLEGGVDALLVCGTTGESSTMTDDEQRKIISYAAEIVDGRIPLLSGASSNSTFHAAKRAKAAIGEGADGVLCVTPYYNKASEEGMIIHYGEIASAIAEPVIVYNVPSRTSCPITVGVLEALKNIPNITGIKEASGKISFVREIIRTFGDRYDVYSGCDDLNLSVMEEGGLGCVSVVSNVLPRKVASMCRAYLGGDISLARRLNSELSELSSLLFCEVNPIPVKAVLSDMGLCREEYRLPLCPVRGAKREALREIAKTVYDI